jgi:hypothetical protein
MKIRRKTLKVSKLANHCKRISEKVDKQVSFASLPTELFLLHFGLRVTHNFLFGEDCI